jgi:predicted transglutaminase-like cysteine proteinase
MPVVILDQVHWAQLEQVQAEVDHKVAYVTDTERFGVPDWWEPAVDRGDCEDIVLAKRDRLIRLGWPADLLRIAVVMDGRNELHAVLTVDVQSQAGRQATYVLDSHFSHVEPWTSLGAAGYTWLERSKPGSSQWARLDSGGAAQSLRIASLSVALMPASPRWTDSEPKAVRADTVFYVHDHAPLVEDGPSMDAASPTLQLAALNADDLPSIQMADLIADQVEDGAMAADSPAPGDQSAHARRHHHDARHRRHSA